MNLDFAGTKWFLLLVAFILPLILLLVSIFTGTGVCSVVLLIAWMGAIFIIFYLPRNSEDNNE